MEKPNPEDFGLFIEDLDNLDKVKEPHPVLYGLMFTTFLIIVIFLITLLLSANSLKDDDIIGLLVVSAIGCCFSFVRLIQNGSSQLRRVWEYKQAKIAYDGWFKRTRGPFWLSLSGKQYEDEISNLFSKLGYKVNLTKSSGDEGIDIFLEKDGEFTAVQCKAHIRPVSPSVAQELYSSMLHEQIAKGIIVSTHGFTNGTADFAITKPIALWGLPEILQAELNLEN